MMNAAAAAAALSQRSDQIGIRALRGRRGLAVWEAWTRTRRHFTHASLKSAKLSPKCQVQILLQLFHQFFFFSSAAETTGANKGVGCRRSVELSVQGRKARRHQAEGEDLRRPVCDEGKRPALNLNHRHMGVAATTCKW